MKENKGGHDGESGKDRIRVLLVDDEKEYLHVLSNRLGKRGLSVVKASSGQEGIQALRRQDFDVAVLDLKLEDMDGIEVLKVFKRMDPNLAVVMLTGHGSAEAARDGIAMGAFGYLSKPCELQDLLSKIKEAYERRKPV